MHILFVHKNFPAQFGHVAAHLVEKKGYECTFVSQRAAGEWRGVRKIQYRLRGGAKASTHYCSRSFENYTWHSHAVYETLKAHPDVRPDLIVGHSGFGSTVFLAELYDAPIINYFEYYYHPRDSDIDFRPEFPTRELNRLRARTRNAMLLLDLETCAAAYSPTVWQRSRFPAHYQGKIDVIFDGVDTRLWRPTATARKPRRMIAGREIPDDVRIVTYVARGFESVRGFDIFMRAAARLCRVRTDVVFVCVGEDRVCYGGDQHHTGGQSFLEYVLSYDDFDLSRFIFTGAVPPEELARIFSLSDLHVYLTVPFVLSWSMMNALSCGCTVLASATPPVQEMITDGENGLLFPFHDIDRLVELTGRVLDDPAAFAPLGVAGRSMIEAQYSLSAVTPQIAQFYDRTAAQCVR